jgi:hypothetical protein
MPARRPRTLLQRFQDQIARIQRANTVRVAPQSKRKAQRCISDTLRAVQCRKRTAHTPKCWIHLAKQENLRIKPSQVVGGGKGLYTWKNPILRGRNISKYTGQRRTVQELDRRYGSRVAQYAVCNSRGQCIDANHTTDGAARFANDSRGTIFQNNSTIKGGDRRIFRLKSTRRIPAHSEIFTPYGAQYWE